MGVRTTSKSKIIINILLRKDKQINAYLLKGVVFGLKLGVVRKGYGSTSMTTAD